MEVSQFLRTFADVIELNRHIEILLLNSDCVIVPDLGGFMTHHVDARYDDEDHMFVPPLRTLGFNPQLTMNDSLLAQSYIEAYDISYPEAMRRIESEVNELKQLLQNEGYYEMNGIGVLSLNEDGRIVFEPCEAGLLTPALYGLGAFEMLPLGETASQPAKVTSEEKAATIELPVITSDETTDEEEEKVQADEERTIVIKMSWLRNVAAVAAAIVLFLVMTPPVANSDFEGKTQLTTSQVEFLPLPKKAELKKAEPIKKDSSAIVAKPDSASTLVAATAKAETPVPAVVKEEPTYCLVLASQVAQKGAENLVEQMKKHGYEDTRINVHKNVRRVVYGHYATQGAAYQALQKLHNASADFNEAWVYKTI